MNFFVFRTFDRFFNLSFLKIFATKSEMKSSIERTGCDHFSNGNIETLIFCKRNVISYNVLGKIFYLSIFFTVLTYFSRETTKVQGKVEFFKSLFRFSIANSFNIKHLSPNLAGPLVVFYQNIQKFWLTSFFFNCVISQVARSFASLMCKKFFVVPDFAWKTKRRQLKHSFIKAQILFFAV